MQVRRCGWAAILAGSVVAGLALVPFATVPAAAVPGTGSTVFVNEFHYDNVGGDTGEFIEIAGPAGTDLTGWSIVRYNGVNPAAAVVYPVNTAVSLSGTIPDQQGGYGTVVVDFPVDGLQNGPNDGFALVNGSTVVQLLSYEGSFTASNGPAAGLSATNLPVSQTGSEPIGSSLQLTGSGTTYGDFTWTKTDGANTKGAPNTGQVLGDGAPPPPPPPPADTCGDPDDPIALISDIQGGGPTFDPSCAGVQTVEAVVTAVKPGLSGFYLQEEEADSDGD
ncbi:MAG TPA: hypothetical protein VK894_08550, partial [Jiangellales bacterium]|nr:hypothetical protein [Jiangellales bacterium]